MNESKIKAKTPLISGSYYKELLREMRTIGIVFAVIQLLFGFFGETGNGASVVFAAASAGIVKRDILLLYFFVAALNFRKGHIARGSWDFRGSLPVTKKTMAATHLLVTLTYAGIIFVAHYIGVAIGEIVIRIPGVEVSSIPPAFGASAVQMLRNMLRGMVLYGVLIMLCSCVTGFLSFFIAAIVIADLPSLFVNVAGKLSVGGNNLAAVFLPIGIRGHEALGWAALIIGAAAAAVLGVVAYSNARAETCGKPARTEWIHIAIGVGFGALVGLGTMRIALSRLMRFVVDGSVLSADMSGTDWTVTIVIALVLMVIAYFAYMWITLKSFKNACKRLIFLPIAAVVIALVFPVALAANAKWNKVDFRAANIDHVNIIDGTLEDSSENLYIELLSEDLRNCRGRSGAERVDLNDPELIRIVSEEAEKARRTMTDQDLVSSVLMSMYGWLNAEQNLEITLKDGSVWTVPVSRSFVTAIVKPYAMKNAEYVEKFADMSRFNAARVFPPENLGREFGDTLLAELKALSPAERAEVFSDDVIAAELFKETDSALTDLISSIVMPGEFDEVIGKVTIVSPTYDHAIVVKITSKLPKTAAMYVQRINERMRSWKNYDEFVSRLESGDFSSFSGILGAGNRGTGFFITPNDGEIGDVYLEKTMEASRIIARAMKREVNTADPKHIISITVDQFTTDSGRVDDYGITYENDLFIKGPQQFFVSMTDEEIELLRDLFIDGKWEPYPDE